jgi:signal transduction histidine kinase
MHSFELCVLSDFLPARSNHNLIGEYMDALAENCTWLVREIRSAYRRDGLASQEVRGFMDDNRVGFMEYFAAGIKHQLNNYYMQMGLALGELAETLNSHRTAESLGLLETMNKLFGTMKHLTDLQSSNRWDSRPEVQPVASVIESVRVLMTIMARRRRVSLKISDQIEGNVRVDRFQFEQVLMNLYRNAEQAILANSKMSGEIQIVTHGVTDDDLDRFPELSERQYLCVTVKNGGPGIDPDTFARIGDLKFTTKPKGEGSGHGLQVCAYLMEENGGFIAAKTHAIAGTEFTLYFPTVEGE